jgi:heme o synthase
VSDIKIARATVNVGLIEKIRDIGVLMKFKLSLTVVFSAVMAYMIAAETSVSFLELTILFLGGLLTSGAASALNQVLERDFDKLMQRTENRPIAADRMNVSEGVLISGLLSLLGVSLLALFNPITAFLGMVSLILYAFVYTPMKRISNLSVAIGAIPGALPVLIGCTAAQNGTVTLLALALFAMQFIWQFPHFWAIAWLADEDYKKAGFKMLPTKDGVKDNNTGRQSFIYALVLIPICWIPYLIEATGFVSAVYLTVINIALAYAAWQFYRLDNRKTALVQMFFSIAYLPLVLIGLYLDKL